jgi:membrane dipeptidase
MLCTFVLCLSLSLDPPAPTKRGPVVPSPEALKLHHESLVCDGHNDLPWEIRDQKKGLEDVDLRKNNKKNTTFHTDIPRLKQGGVNWQFWSAYVPSTPNKERGSFIRQTMEQIDLIHRMVKKYPDVFEMANTADDVLRIQKAGKVASMIGVEGGHSIENSLPMLRIYHQLGVRYMTLTHSENTDWADSATDKPKSNGLSPFGDDVVREMNRIGMLVDISHVSPEAMKRAIAVSQAPVIFSHSSAFAIAPHVRNVPDDVLKMLPKNGGVVMVNFFSGFVTPDGVRVSRNLLQNYREMQKKYPKKEDLAAAMQIYRRENPIPKGTIHDVVDHVMHIVKTAGVDHVGWGSDYDGISTAPHGMEDVTSYPLLTQCLLDRGLSPTDVKKILGGNILRVMKEAENVAKNGGVRIVADKDGWIDLFAVPKFAAFRPVKSDWYMTAAVSVDSRDVRKLTGSPGEGPIAVNGNGRTTNLLTKQSFGDCELQFDFLMPKGSNSGVKFHGHYEVQLYDSYGKTQPLYGGDNGGVYPRSESKPKYRHIDKGIAPKSNASKPPGEWQRMEIVFIAPRFDSAGKRTQKAKVTVKLNDQIVQDNLELEWPTGNAWKNKEHKTGPLLIQADHGPVAFRNFRIREIQK